MTSNIGSEFSQEMADLGFSSVAEENREKKEEDLKEKIRKALERHFRPEFLNRLDEIIIFNSLTSKVIVKIVEQQLEKVKARMAEKDISINFGDSLKKYIMEKGYSEHYGARPIKRAIQSHLLNKLAEEIIVGRIKAGDEVLIDAKEGKIEFVFSGGFSVKDRHGEKLPRREAIKV